MARRDELHAYRVDVGRGRSLTAEMEVALVLRSRAGDRRATHTLIEACLVAVLAIAFEYRRWGVPLADVVQEGNLGVIKAVERFDPAFGVRLTTYAGMWIRATIREFVARHVRIVRLGSTKAARRALRIFMRTREQRPDHLAAQSGLSERCAEALIGALLHHDLRLGPDDAEAADASGASSEGSPTPEDAVSAAEEREQVRRTVSAAVARLSTREQEIVQHRLLADTPTTLEQVGATWGVSKERARQIEAGALARLRALLGDFAGPDAQLRGRVPAARR